MHFTLHNQSRGVHFYRIVPIYEQDMMGNCSELLTHTIKMNLPAPTNPELAYKEYYTKWNVKFKFSAPQYQGLTLKGYRWVVSNNGHQVTGKTDSPNQNLHFHLLRQRKSKSRALCCLRRRRF